MCENKNPYIYKSKTVIDFMIYNKLRCYVKH